MSGPKDVEKTADCHEYAARAEGALTSVFAARWLYKWHERPAARPGPEYVLQQHRRYLVALLRDLAEGVPTRLIDGIKASIAELERIDCTKCGAFEYVVQDDRCVEHKQ